MNSPVSQALEIALPAAAHCRRPVMANVPANSAVHLKNILVPIEFSEMALKPLQYAVVLARRCGARLTLLHVVAPGDYRLDFSFPVPLEAGRLAELGKELDDFRTARIPAEIPVETMVRQCRVIDAVLEAARQSEADLIITATHGYVGLDRLLLGSTAEAIVRRAPCPVLIVREFERDFI